MQQEDSLSFHIFFSQTDISSSDKLKSFYAIFFSYLFINSFSSYGLLAPKLFFLSKLTYLGKCSLNEYILSFQGAFFFKILFYCERTQ